MKEFLKLNRKKLKFAFGLTFITFTVIVLGIFLYSYVQGLGPESTLFITVILGFGIGLPFFIFLVSTIRGSWDLRKRRSAFNQEPFLDLLHHGFSEHMKNENNRWKFVEPVLRGKVDDYQIVAEVNTQFAPDVIRFQALTEIHVISKDEIKRLSKKFAIQGIELDYEGVTKMISVKKHRLKSGVDLITELNHFIFTIKSEKFKPLKIGID